jgi:hypothetical protein
VNFIGAVVYFVKNQRISGTRVHRDFLKATIASVDEVSQFIGKFISNLSLLNISIFFPHQIPDIRNDQRVSCLSIAFNLESNYQVQKGFFNPMKCSRQLARVRAFDLIQVAAEKEEDERNVEEKCCPFRCL